MNTGRYDQRVLFRSFQDVSDGHGGTTPIPVTLLETFAAVKQVKSSSDLEQLQNDLNKVYKIAIRHRLDFTPSQGSVIVYRGDELTIQQVDLSGERHRREYIITAMYGDNTNADTGS